MKLISENKDDVTVAEVVKLFPDLVGGIATLERGVDILGHGSKQSEEVPTRA
jgi:hypothetical protein